VQRKLELCHVCCELKLSVLSQRLDDGDMQDEGPECVTNDTGSPGRVLLIITLELELGVPSLA